MDAAAALDALLLLPSASEGAKAGGADAVEGESGVVINRPSLVWLLQQSTVEVCAWHETWGVCV